MPRKPIRRSRKPLPAAAPPVRQLWHPDVPGPLWNGTRRVPRRQIEAYCRVVAREFKPEKIILFGSYAYGRPTLDSDVDLVVVMPHRGRDVDYNFMKENVSGRLLNSASANRRRSV